jgi:hypothetical protein
MPKLLGFPCQLRFQILLGPADRWNLVSELLLAGGYLPTAGLADSRHLHPVVVRRPGYCFGNEGTGAFGRPVADDAQQFCWCNSGKLVEKVPIAGRPFACRRLKRMHPAL